MSAADQLKAFIAKFDARDQRLIRAVRSAMRNQLPTAHELVYDNYNFLVIGFSPSERPSDAIFSIAARAASFASTRPIVWRIPMSKRSSPRQSHGQRRRCRRVVAETDHPVDFRETAAASPVKPCHSR